jgi:phosphoglycerol transferase MdoB-like AlkP superfamily enzyme
MRLFYLRLPRLLRWLAAIWFCFLLLATVARMLFYARYNPPGQPISGAALWMGLRFDVKFVSILVLALLACCALPPLHPFRKPAAAKWWNVVLTILFAAVVLVYVIDFYHYDYIQQRLNASFINYFNDAAITLNMGLASYPVVKITLGILALTAMSLLFFKRLTKRLICSHVIDHRSRPGCYLLVVLLLAAGIFGKLGQFNLRWSDAFSLSSNFKAQLALNPFQSFFSTLKYKDTGPNAAKARSYYGLMSQWLGVQQPDSMELNYTRQHRYTAQPAPTNVVLVICESFCMFRSTMAGNYFNTTPYFDSLCRQGIFFDRCFTPSFPTARGVWATITGLPDVLGDNNRTASRNPDVVNQQTIFNQLQGYKKYYFIGGDPSWANIKGVLLNNIDGLTLYEQDSFAAKKADVWGIDDKSLLLEANQKLAQQTQPFFAVIQTADNHKPYTIPKAELPYFKILQPPADTVRKYGFEDVDQLNAFRYTDYCFSAFMEAAKKEKYFANTLFVFVGDHGLPGNANEVYPHSFTEHALTRLHVPLLFYAPGILPAQVRHLPCSQLDVMASIASLLRQPYTNTGMGISLFDSNLVYPPAVYTIDHEAGTTGMVTPDYYFIQYNKANKTFLANVQSNAPVPQNVATDSIRQKLQLLTNAYTETARYMLYNNKRK